MSLVAPREVRSRGRWLVALVEGDSLREAGLALGVQQGSRIRFDAHGHIDAVRLAGRAPRPDRMAVIALHGSIHDGQIDMVLLGVTAGGEVIAGQLHDARAVDLELDVEAFDLAPEALASPSPSPTTRSPSPVPGPLSPVSPSPSPSPSWSDVIAASQAPPDEPEEEPVELPRPGDQIEHQNFGVCRVEKLEEDEDFVLVRSQQGRLLRLSLDVLRLDRLPDADGARRFRSRPRDGGRGGRTR